jgi:hypothetical protein
MAGMADNYKKDNWEKGQGTETVMSTAARETLSV